MLQIFQEILNKIDLGITPDFAVSLAGLSLAAAAFFSPLADNKVSQAKKELDNLEPLIDRALENGIYSQTAMTEKYNQLRNAITVISDGQSALVKAFYIFSWFVAYTISLDQVFDVSFVRDVLGIDSPIKVDGIISIDLLIGLYLLGLGGRNLWKGAKGIRQYFGFDFNEEKEILKKIIKGVKSK